MYGLMEINLALGNTVVIDAPHMTQMNSDAWRNMILKVVEETGAVLKVVKCTATYEELATRLKARGLGRDQEKPPDPSAFDPIDTHIPFDYIDVNTAEPSNCLLSKVLAFLSQ